jgi:hypothetical protein
MMLLSIFKMGQGKGRPWQWGRTVYMEALLRADEQIIEDRSQPAEPGVGSAGKDWSVERGVQRRTAAQQFWDISHRESLRHDLQRSGCLRLPARRNSKNVSRRNDELLRTKLVEAAREEPKWGYRRLQLKLEAKGMLVNYKRVYRVCREAGLLIRRRRRKRLLRAGFVRPALTGANQEWAMAGGARVVVGSRTHDRSTQC